MASSKTPAGDIYTVNLEEGMPYCRDAIRRLTYELNAAQRQGRGILKLIHGYGSSGSGGRIRVECRKCLAICKKQGLVEEFIEGERLDIFEPRTQKALQKYPALSRDRDMQRSNNGITVVLVSLK